MVHFAKSQVHWECVTCNSSEGIPPGLHLENGSDRKLKIGGEAMTLEDGLCPHDFYFMWDTLLDAYTSGRLTYASDKAIAIQGLASIFARHFQTTRPDGYVNGIWRSRFIDGLSWSTNGECSRNSTGAASWSWMSVDGPVMSTYCWGGDSPKGRSAISQIVEVQADCTLHHPIASARGYARIKGPMCKASLHSTKRPSAGPFEPENQYSLFLGTDKLDCLESFHLVFDASEYGASLHPGPKTVYLLLARALATYENSPRYAGLSPSDYAYYGADDYECLVLEPAPDKDRCLRRVAYLRFSHHAFDWQQPDSLPGKKVLFSTIDKHFRSHDLPAEVYESVDEDFMYTITLV